MATAATAAPARAAQVIRAPIGAVRIWKGHVRTVWDVPGQTLEQLGDSIVRDGQTTPAKARIPEPGVFELINGARRLKACTIKGIPTIDLIIEDDVSDFDMLHRQFVDNSGVPLHPLDEAKLLEEMRRVHGMTIEQIVAETGFDVSDVRRRLKLCNLTKQNRALYAEGKIDDALAYAAGRVEAEAVQNRVIDRYVKGDLRYDDALRDLRRSATRNLALAPWKLDDLSLNPKAPAPSCAACPEHTLAQMPLFGDMYKPDDDGYTDTSKADDFCTRPDCYAIKLKAVAQARIDEAKKLKIPVLSKAEAAKVFDESEPWRAELRGVQWRGGYVPADTQIHEYTKDKTTWRGVMENALPHALAIDPDGFPRWLYKRKEAETARDRQSKAKARAEGKASPKKSANDKRAEQKRKADREKARLFDAIETRLIAAAVEKAANTDATRLITVLAHLVADSLGYRLRQIAEKSGRKIGELEKMPEKGAASARALLVELLFAEAADHDYNDRGKVETYAKMLRVDVAAVRAAAIKADQGERAAAKASKKAKKS